VLDRLQAQLFIGITEAAFAIAHDEMLHHPLIGRATIHFGEIRAILRFLEEERIDVLNGVEAELLSRHPGKIQVLELLALQSAVQRPLGEGNLERRFLTCLQVLCGCARLRQRQCGSGAAAQAKKVPAAQSLVHVPRSGWRNW
ncbi:MAG TPA: hypothetical protein VK864_10800, partial [Longimicrobiales bacterium]|nr:hypothetical protein [Longimicrobiales bacterium]